MIKANKADDL